MAPTQVVPMDHEDLEKAQQAPERRPVKIWELFKYATWGEVFVLFIGALFALAQGSTLPLFAVLIGNSIDASITGVTSAEEQMRPVLRDFTFIMIGVLVTATVWQATYFWVAERQAARLRKSYLAELLRKDISWFDVNDATELPSRMASEVQMIQDATGPKFAHIMMLVSQFVVGLVIAFTRGWELSLVMCGGLPIFAGVGYWFSKVVSELSQDKQSSYGKAGAVAEEALMAIRTVAAFGGEQREVERYAKHLNQAKKGALWAGLQMGAAIGSLMASFAIFYAVAFWYGSHQMVGTDKINPQTNKPYTGADVILIFFSVIIGVSSVQDMAAPCAAVSAALTAAARMFPLLESESLIESRHPTLTAEDANKALANAFNTNNGLIRIVEFSAVEFCYPSKVTVKILKKLSLTINRGQKVALVGESGSGKSTCIQLLERYYDPTGGSVKINGVQLKEIPVYALRRQIGYVGQEPVLFSTTVLENIQGGDKSITEDQAISAAKQAQAYEFLNGLPKKFDTYVGVGGGQMSGGQKQRIAIARALAKQPQILLLDEATSALDNQSEKEVQKTLDELQKGGDSNLTTISVAHRLSTIKNSNVIFFLKNGAVQEKGSHEELMAKQGEYYQLVQIQAAANAEVEHEVKVDEVTPLSEIKQNVEEDDADPGRESSKGISTNKSKNMTISSQPSQTGFKPKLSEKEIEAQRLKELNESKKSPPLGRIFGMAKQEYGLFPVALLGSLLAGGSFPAQGYALCEAIPGFYLPKDAMRKKILEISLAYIIIAAACLVGEIIKYSVFTYTQECLTLRLREQSFTALVRQDIGFFDDPANSPTGLTTALERATSAVAKMTGITLGQVFSSALAMVSGLALGFIGSWKLSLAVLGLIPFVMAAMIIVVQMTMPTEGKSASTAYTQAGEVAAEAILNVRTVRALLSENQSLAQFGEAVDKAAAKEGGFNCWKKGFGFGFGNSLLFTIYLMGFGLGAYLIDHDGLSQQKMYQVIFCILFGVFGAGIAMAFIPDANKGKLASYDICEILDRESRVDAMAPLGKYEDLGNGKIEFDDVKFTYPHRPELPVLHGLSFSVTKGQSVALVGPSGSGKSTVIQLLLRFYDPTSGSLLVGGVDLKQFNVAWWRKRVGFVGQEPILFDMSLMDNVKYGTPDATQQQVEAAAQEANMDYVFSGKKDWKDNVGIKGGKLSGGQKQRCAIARALVRQPEILLLDEATSALDSVSEQQVQQALDNVKKGRTTFTIAHRLSTIKDANLILVIESGKLKEQGTHEELMALKGLYHTLTTKGAE